MSIEKRRFKRIALEMPVRVSLYDRKKKAHLGEPLAGSVKNFSPVGAALTVAAIQLDGHHLFYTCQDHPDIVIELAFEPQEDLEIDINIPASPVWFDRDLDSDKKQFVIGLEFLLPAKSREIKSLCRIICPDERLLVTLWKKIF